MTHNYYYKHESQDNIVYIHCKWLNDVSLDAQPDLVICEISVSDTTTFWSNNGTHNGSLYIYIQFEIVTRVIPISHYERYPPL